MTFAQIARCPTVASQIEGNMMSGFSIRKKLLSLWAVAIASLIVVNAFAFWQTWRLYQDLDAAGKRYGHLIEAVDKARGAQVRFKTQVQEWKNILLRGKDQAALKST